MKKIIVVLALIITPALSFGQSLFDSLEDMDGVSSAVITKDAFQILSKFKVEVEDNEALEVFKMIQNLQELKFFKTEEKAVANKMESMVNSAIKKSKLTQLMRIKEDDARVKIYVKAGSNKDYVSEVLMFVKGVDKHTNGNAESIIVSLTGMIDINKLSKLADTYTKGSKVKVKVN